MEIKVNTLIIGAGFSGLSAGVRLSQFQDNVMIIEAHNITGGLNSYYTRKINNKTLTFNTGLHTVTNFKIQNRKWGLGLICRNLGISKEEFNLSPAKYPSMIKSKNGELVFSNDYKIMEDSVKLFSKNSFDEFNNFVKYIQKKGSENEWAELDCWTVLKSHFRSKELIDLLSIPVFYYAGYKEKYIDFLTYSTIFRSIFLDGCCSPGSIKRLLLLLVNRLESNGGVIKFNTKAKKIITYRNKIVEVHTNNGDIIKADNILSSIGIAEIGFLLKEKIEKPSNVSLFESVFCYDSSILLSDIKYTLVFSYNDNKFNWVMPRLGNTSPYYSMTFLYNYNFPTIESYQVKICTFQSGKDWLDLSSDEYKSQKEKYSDYLKKYLYNEFSSLNNANLIYTDSFSPRTIYKYTGHSNGAIYGCSSKSFSGKTKYKNLYIIGNDQGGIGIMGAITSGIVISNYNIIL